MCAVGSVPDWTSTTLATGSISTGPSRADSPAYTKVDVALAYTLLQSERQTLELFGRVENLFDEDYEEAYGFASPGFAAFGGIRLTL